MAMYPQRDQRLALARRLERMIELMSQVELLKERLLATLDWDGNQGIEMRPGLEDYQAVLEWLSTPQPREVTEYRDCLQYVRQAERKLALAERRAS
jgi:hypothetical protein